MSIFKVETSASKKVRTDTMFAVRMHSYGGPEVLKYEEIPRPKSGAGELLLMVHAAAGGVGHLAVQLAKWAGARVIGTASKSNLDFLMELGVDEAIDYQATRFEDVVHKVDMVLDTIGGETQKRSLKVLAKGGILVSIVSQPSQEEADSFGVRQSFVFVRNNATQLAEISDLVDSGLLIPTVETVLSLSEAYYAQELNKAGHTRGKIVLRIV